MASIWVVRLLAVGLLGLSIWANFKQFETITDQKLVISAYKESEIERIALAKGQKQSRDKISAQNREINRQREMYHDLAIQNPYLSADAESLWWANWMRDLYGLQPYPSADAVPSSPDLIVIFTPKLAETYAFLCDESKGYDEEGLVNTQAPGDPAFCDYAFTGWGNAQGWMNFKSYMLEVKHYVDDLKLRLKYYGSVDLE